MRLGGETGARTRTTTYATARIRRATGRAGVALVECGERGECLFGLQHPEGIRQRVVTSCRLLGRAQPGPGREGR